MKPCKRGCCWSPYGCATASECDCHPTPLTDWLGTPANEPTNRLGHRDPTANQAVMNVMRQRKGNAR